MGQKLTEPRDDELDQAIARGAVLSQTQISALTVRYDGASDAIVVELSDGKTLRIPRKKIEGLGQASESDVAAIEILGSGSGLHWHRLDVDLSVAGLAAGIFGTRSWMKRLAETGGGAEP